jgi:AraC-binding-like domain
MSTRAADAMQVQVQGGDVESLHERGVTWVSFKPIPGQVCGIDFALRKLPDLGLLSGTVRGVRHEHARRDSGDGDDDFSFHMNLSGLSLVAGERGETTLRDGDAMLLSYSVSRIISRPDLVDHRVIRLPRAVLSSLVRNIDDAVQCRIPRGTGMLRLLKSYVDAVFDDPALAVPQTRQLIVAQLCDLARRVMQPQWRRDAASVPLGWAPSRAISKRTSRMAAFLRARSHTANRYQTATFANYLKVKEHHSRSTSLAADSIVRAAC